MNAPARTLYEIKTDLDALAALLAEVGGDVTEAEAEAAIDAWLRETDDAMRVKLDNYAALIREIDARGNTRMEEAARLTALARIDHASTDRMKARVLAFLEEQGIEKVETARFRLTVCGNGGRTPLKLLVNPEDLPTAWREAVVTYRPLSDAIRAELEAGVALPFARLEERGKHLRIK